MRIFLYLTCAIALFPLASCNKGQQATPVTTSTVAGLPRNEVSLSADIPTERDGSTYCTVMVNGSYDLTMKDPSTGEDVLTLDRVCTNFSEAYVAGDGPKVPAAHTLDAHNALTVKKASRSFIGLSFQSEFFEQAQRITMYTTTPSTATNFGCTTTPLSRTSDSHDKLLVPNGPAILKNASSNGILHIHGRFATSC